MQGVHIIHQLPVATSSINCQITTTLCHKILPCKKLNND
jgi:hypothetical protein